MHLRSGENRVQLGWEASTQLLSHVLDPVHRRTQSFFQLHAILSLPAAALLSLRVFGR